MCSVKMKKSELRRIIIEAVKRKLREKHDRTSDFFITSPTEDDITLYINVKIEAKDMKEAEKLKDDILETLTSKFDIKAAKRDK